MSARPALLEEPARTWKRRSSTLCVTPASSKAALVAEPLLAALGEVLGRALGVPLSERDRTLRVHRFEPQGLSVVWVLADLRAVLHTWPEHNLATLDLAGPDEGSLERLELAVALALGLTRVPAEQVQPGRVAGG